MSILATFEPTVVLGFSPPVSISQNAGRLIATDYHQASVPSSFDNSSYHFGYLSVDSLSTSRHTTWTMKTDTTPNSKAQPRKIVGLSLPPEVTAELKMEAARRGVSLRALFLEMWTLYKKTSA